MENRLTKTIKKLMKERGIKTQKQMATLLGIDPAQFSRMMRMPESESVNVGVLSNLHTHFGVTPNDVLMVDDSKEIKPTFSREN